MSRKFAQQKAALTRAVKSGDYDKVVAVTATAIDEWENHADFGYWPDDWARWQRALDDTWHKVRMDYMHGSVDTVPQRVDMDDL